MNMATNSNPNTVTLPSFKELMQEIQEMEILHSIEKPHFAPAHEQARLAPPPLRLRPESNPSQVYHGHNQAFLPAMPDMRTHAPQYQIFAPQPRPLMQVQYDPDPPQPPMGPYYDPRGQRGRIITQPRSEMRPPADAFSATPQFVHYYTHNYNGADLERAQMPIALPSANMAQYTPQETPQRRPVTAHASTIAARILAKNPLCGKSCVRLTLLDLQSLVEEYSKKPPAHLLDGGHAGKRQLYKLLPSGWTPVVSFKATNPHSGHFGVPLTDIKSYRSCMQSPEELVMGHHRDAKISLVLQFEGYPMATRKVQVRCACGTISRYKLALEIAEKCSRYFKTELSSRVSIVPGRHVRGIQDLRLVSLFTSDGGVNYRPHFAAMLDN